MKGFIYLIEIAVAAILMTVVLTVFFSIRIKQDWEKSDLITAGFNILSSIKNGDNFLMNILNEDLGDIESNRPANIKYGLRVLGSPKSKIYIGCAIECDYITRLLNPSSSFGSIYVNGRWINFTVNSFDINLDSGIPSYDVIILVNYTNYSNPAIKARLNNYLIGGGVVIAINATKNATDTSFNNIFNLTYVSGAASSPVNFTFYDPYRNEIAKYFLGIGMDAYSYWRIWEGEWRIDYWGTNRINITNTTDETINRTNLREGDTFNINGPDSNAYMFKIKKLWWSDRRVDIQALNKSFIFKNFAERNVTGNNIISYSNYAALATNRSAIWISDFGDGDEYRTLLKAAILYGTDSWTAKGVYTAREKTTISSFIPLCCDMPEIAELYLTLWYEI